MNIIASSECSYSLCVQNRHLRSCIERRLWRLLYNQVHDHVRLGDGCQCAAYLWLVAIMVQVVSCGMMFASPFHSSCLKEVAGDRRRARAVEVGRNKSWEEE